MWEAILSDGPSPRTEIAHTITNEWNVVNGLKPCIACGTAGHDKPGVTCTNVSAVRFQSRPSFGQREAHRCCALLLSDVGVYV